MFVLDLESKLQNLEQEQELRTKEVLKIRIASS